jgi:hypothetical protein
VAGTKSCVYLCFKKKYLYMLQSMACYLVLVCLSLVGIIAWVAQAAPIIHNGRSEVARYYANRKLRRRRARAS